MELRILGPLEVAAGSRVSAPTPGNQRTLLAFLVLHANERVGADRLIDAVWGERPPATAAAALQNQVTRLRRLLGAERIDTEGSTYLLHLAPGELDADRFEELVRRARSAPAAERVELLHSALALWRGRPLGDVEDELFAQSEIARLEELRLVALEQRLDAELELGGSAELVPELEALAREQPLREGVRAKLMLALYRSGRQAEALEVYQQTRALLVDELGIEPQEPLKRLHQRILLQDAELDLEQEPPPAAATPASPPAPLRETRKTVTALVLSIGLPATHDPELVGRLEERAAAIVSQAVERHGGTLQQAGGADTLAVFGAPLLHEDDALRAVRAADEARAALAALDAGLTVRAGIATGTALIGSKVIGGPLGAARDLSRRAAAGEILLGPETRSLVRDAAACEPAGDGALRLVRLDSTAPAVARRLDTPLVNRERELLLLETAFAHAVRSSHCHLFTVCGPGGIGKSRLVAELVRTLGGEARVLSGGCLSYGEGSTYWPVVEIVRGAAAVGENEPGDVRERLAGLVPGPDGEVVAERLAGLLGLGPPAQADEIAWAVRRLLEALATDRPLLVIVDDLQYAEPTLLDLLEGLADRSRGAPILIACLARPELLELRPGWGGGMSNATTVSLEPLDTHESALLLERLPGSSTLDPSTRARVIERAGGHPLFVEELLALIAEQGEPSGDGEPSLPLTVQSLLAGRLERLPDPERLALECASVEGETFHTGALATLAPELAPSAGAAAVTTLMRKDFVRPAEAQLAGSEAVRFRHALIRDAAYAALPKTRRAVLHERFAVWLEQAAAARLTELEEVLAYHLEQAFRLREELGTLDGDGRALGERAGRLLAGAGRRAYERSDMPAATNLLERAALLLPPDDHERLRLLIDLGDALRAGGAFDRADAVLAEAASRSAAAGLHATRAHADLERAVSRTYTDSDTPHAFELVRRAATSLIADPAAAEDGVALAKALTLLGLWHWNALRNDEAAAFYRRAGEIADGAGARRGRRFGQLGIALTFITGPIPVAEGLAALETLREAARGDERTEACLMMYAGMLESMRGEFEEARALLARGAEVLEDLGHHVLRATLDHFAVLAELAADDPVAAERIARHALEALSAVGVAEEAAAIASTLAETLHRQGRDDEAEPQLALAAEVAGTALLQVRRATTTAKVHARRGDPAAAVALARETIGLLEPTDALLLRGDAYLALSEALAAAGDPAGAAAAAAEATSVYDAKGATALSAQAAAFRERVGASAPSR